MSSLGRSYLELTIMNTDWIGIKKGPELISLYSVTLGN